MQLPVDIKALIDETTNLKAARETKISVSVYIDETAPDDVVAHVRNAFASSLPTVRMTITYIGGSFAPQPTDDVAIVVAGTSEATGKYASDLRELGVPVMVVTTMPLLVGELADKSGYPIPKGDLIAPDPAEAAKEGELAGEDGEDAAEEDAASAAVAPDELVEPIELTSQLGANLDERMGRWIVSVCREKRLAYAIAFPFVRRPLARDAVQATSLQNAGVGLVPIIPGADLPIMTLNQAKMVLQIAAAYGQEMDKNRFKELGAVIVNAYFCRNIVRKAMSVVPVLGFAVKTGVAYAGTAAIGYAVIEYFEGGQDVTGVANVIEHATEKGAKAVTALQGVSDRFAPLAGKLSEVRGAAGKVADGEAAAAKGVVDKVAGAKGLLDKLASTAASAVKSSSAS